MALQIVERKKRGASKSKAKTKVLEDRPKFKLPDLPRTAAPKLPEHVIEEKPIRDDATGKPEDWTMPVETIPYFESLDINELKQALSRNDTQKAQDFLHDLCDVSLRGIGVSALAARNGIRINELYDIWRNHRLMAALGIIADGTPKVAADTLEDSLSTIVCCNRCDGAGEIRVMRESGYEWISCKTCKGSGEVRKAGDAKSRDYIYRISGLIKPEGAAVQINFQGGPGADSILDEIERMSAIDISGD